MAECQATVFIVDDDKAVRDGLAELASAVKLGTRTFGTAQEFLNAYDPSQSGCLLLDVRLPGMSGLRLQDELIARGVNVPIIFILSGHGDLPREREVLQLLKIGKPTGTIAKTLDISRKTVQARRVRILEEMEFGPANEEHGPPAPGPWAGRMGQSRFRSIYC